MQKSLDNINNVRVEIDYDIKGPGIVISTESGIINASLSEQFKSFDKLFGKVGLKGRSEDIGEILEECEPVKDFDPDAKTEKNDE